MYTHCLRCNHSLGTNDELTHLPVGRRVAFDTPRGRLWVVCTSCTQWNLVPIEERWEALEECEQVAASAETRASGADVGLARTERGLELLRASAISNVDIANWRYGRRLKRRLSIRSLLSAISLAVVALPFGLGALALSGSMYVSLYSSACVVLWFGAVRRESFRLFTAVTAPRRRRRLIWFWQLNQLRFKSGKNNEPPVLIVPRFGEDQEMRGDGAVDFLAALLPRLNGVDCVASVQVAVERVDDAESQHTPRPSRKKRFPSPKKLHPWEYIASLCVGRPLHRVEPARRLALEMAVMEVIEQRELSRAAGDAVEVFRDEQQIAAIADDLLLAPHVNEQLAEIRKSSGDRKREK